MLKDDPMRNSRDVLVHEDGQPVEAYALASGRVPDQRVPATPVTETRGLTDALYGALGHGTWDEYDLFLAYADVLGDDGHDAA